MAIAFRFAEAGATLELVDINEDMLTNVKQELGKFRTEINTHRIDLAKKTEIDGLWKTLRGREPYISQ